MLTLIEEGRQPQTLIRMWLQMREAKPLDAALGALIKAEKGLRIHWDPDAFYGELTPHHDDDEPGLYDH